MSVYFPSTPSKLNVQVFVFLFLVTLFILPSILSLWELHALSLYKPLCKQRAIPEIWSLENFVLIFNYFAHLCSVCLIPSLPLLGLLPEQRHLSSLPRYGPLLLVTLGQYLLLLSEKPFPRGLELFPLFLQSREGAGSLLLEGRLLGFESGRFLLYLPAFLLY